MRASMPKFLLFSCHIFVYNFQINLQRTPCAITKTTGLWTDFMKMTAGNADYVAIMMDDVYLPHYDLSSYINLMESYNIDAAAASLNAWHWKTMIQQPNCLFRRTSYIDMLFTVFTNKAFQCWQNQIDLDLNHYGWAYDITFAKTCNVQLAVFDTHVAVHASGQARGNARLYDENEAMTQMWNWLKHKQVNFIDHSKSHDYKMQDLIKYMDNTDISCEPIPILGLADSTYFLSVEHRGGWKYIMQELLQSNVISTQKSKYSLIDCSESFFMWEKKQFIHHGSESYILHKITRHFFQNMKLYMDC